MELVSEIEKHFFMFSFFKSFPGELNAETPEFQKSNFEHSHDAHAHWLCWHIIRGDPW
jgi:hypothetical protein